MTSTVPSSEYGADNTKKKSDLHTTPDGPKGTAEWSPGGWRFWLIITSLCLIVFLATLDGSIIVVVLPLISRELDASSSYIWIANSFMLAQTIIQPPCAQLANIFGRRYPMLVSIVVFALGSGIAGGAVSTPMLIGGRTVQGLGAGAIMMLVELIVCDLVPSRQRGTYLGIVMAGGAFGAIVGPVIGGSLALKDWRWCFYMNLPICAVIFVAVAFLLRLKHTREPTWIRAFQRIDWLGDLIFIASSSLLLIGLVFGGNTYPWSSFRVILPIVLGVAGGIIFLAHQSSRFCAEPSVPPRIFANRTSAAGFGIHFISSMTLQWVCLVWPLYFQGVRQASPFDAGVKFVPFEVFLIFFAPVSGILLSKFGVYRPLHILGFALSILGPGLNILLTEHTRTVVWVVFQAVDAIGRAFLVATILPAILSSLPEADTAVATGLFGFLRSFGWMWGLTLPGIIFDSRFNHASHRIADPDVRARFENGGAYQLAGGEYFKSLSGELQEQIVAVYMGSLKTVWIAVMAFGVLGLVLVPVQRQIALRSEIGGEFGLEEKRGEGSVEKGRLVGDEDAQLRAVDA